jgi:hypothetical protein
MLILKDGARSKRMLEHSEPLAQIAEALAAAQAAFGPILKDKTAEIQSQRTGKSFSYSYVDLATIMDAVRPHLGANGLAIVQDTALENGAVQITTLILHKSGEWLKGMLAMPCDTTDPRSVGIGATYGRRYHLQGMLGIAAETDTDAEGAGKSKPAAQSQRTETGEVGEEDLCPVHKVPWQHKEGVYKDGHAKAGQPYSFWSCPTVIGEKDGKRQFCGERPPHGYGSAAAGNETGADPHPGEAVARAEAMKKIEAALPKPSDRLKYIRAYCAANGVPQPASLPALPTVPTETLIGIAFQLKTPDTTTPAPVEAQTGAQGAENAGGEDALPPYPEEPEIP